MKTVGYKLYCRICRKIADAYKCHTQEKALHENKPESDVISVCCATCNKPIMKVTKPYKSSN